MRYHVSFKFFGIAHAINARYRRHHNHIAPTAHEGRGGRKPEFVDFLVDGQVFFDVGIGGGNEGFRLVIVVVGNEILDCVFGEKLLEFAVKLSRQGFVMAQYQRWPVGLRNEVGNREGLTRAGYAQ